MSLTVALIADYSSVRCLSPSWLSVGFSSSSLIPFSMVPSLRHFPSLMISPMGWCGGSLFPVVRNAGCCCSINRIPSLANSDVSCSNLFSILLVDAGSFVLPLGPLTGFCQQVVHSLSRHIACSFHLPDAFLGTLQGIVFH